MEKQLKNKRTELTLEKNIHMAGFREQEVEHEC